MDRVLVYPASIPRSVDLLNTNRSVMIALGMLAQEMLGTPTIASGFACTPTAPATLSVSVAGGRLYSLQQVDPLAYSTLSADTTDQIVKQGILLTTSTLSCPAPAASGQSVNYLIEASFSETDTNPIVLPYYNASNPSQPFSGPSNNGSANYTTRSDTVVLTVKAGTSATTGTQVTPAPDSGYVGLWVVTVAYGQTTITAGNIAQYSAAPLLGGSLLQAIQNSAFTSGPDVGVANAYAANYAPAITTLTNNMELEFEAAHANTGASTFSPNGLTAAPILNRYHVALQGGEIIAGSKVVVIWKASITSWILVESTGGATSGGKAGIASHIGWLPTGAATDVLSASFTAPCNGTVIVKSIANTTSSQGAVITNYGTINSVNGSQDSVNDSSTTLQSATVTAGQAVALSGTLSVSVAATVGISHWLEWYFIPS